MHLHHFCIVLLIVVQPISSSVFVWKQFLTNRITFNLEVTKLFFQQKVPVSAMENTAKIINSICPVVLGYIKPKPINRTGLSFILMTPCRHIVYDVESIESILVDPAFDLAKPTIIYVNGWRMVFNDILTGEIPNAYVCRGDFNIIGIDISTYMSGRYLMAAVRTQELGEEIAKLLISLSPGLSPTKLHLIGFSLGAHIVGQAGRTYKNLTGEYVERITGLDPANFCFYGKIPGLTKGDARFVDIIHSSPGVVGKREPVGDVDFYTNGLNSVPEGCLNPNNAHQVAVKSFAESIYLENEEYFIAFQCESFERLEKGNCSMKGQDVMGFKVSMGLKGVFIVNNTKINFCKNSKIVERNKCNVCL